MLPNATVAIWPFDDNSINRSQNWAFLEWYFADSLSEQFSKEKQYQLVERKKLMKLLEEQDIGTFKLADEKTRLRLGRILGARYMIFGAFIIYESKLQVDARIVEVETSITKKGASVHTSVQEYEEAPKHLFQQFKQENG